MMRVGQISHSLLSIGLSNFACLTVYLFGTNIRMTGPDKAGDFGPYVQVRRQSSKKPCPFEEQFSEV